MRVTKATDLRAGPCKLQMGLANRHHGELYLECRNDLIWMQSSLKCVVFINDLPRNTRVPTELYAADTLLHTVTSLI